MEFLEKQTLTTGDPKIFAVVALLDCGHRRYKTGLNMGQLMEVLDAPFANCLECKPAPPVAHPGYQRPRTIQLDAEEARCKAAWAKIVKGGWLETEIC